MKIPGFLLLTALAAHAAQTPPKPLEPASPGYPAALTDTGIGGSAAIELVVKADGSVADARVKSADHEAFGQAALTAVQAWKFEPATVDGAAVDKKVTVPFNFVAPVTQQLNAKFKRRVFQPVTEPVLTQKEFGKKLKATKPVRAAYPAAAKGASGDVQVKFVVAPDGTTINPEIVSKTPRREFVAPAILAVAAATYEPPVKDGKGVYVETTTKVSFAPPQAARKRGGGNAGGGGGFGGGDAGGGGFGGGGPPDE